VTLACGTGACASAVATLATSRARGPLEVHLPGGVLTLQWKGAGHPIFMRGPATEVFRGEIEI
jgi:diaminopimelate epimerase